VDSSKTGIQLSAPGYPQKIVNVACLPSGLYVGKPDLRIQSSQGAISVVTAAIDPVSQALVQVQNPRGGLDAIRVDASTANTNLQIGTSTVTIDSLSSFPTTGSYDPNAISFQFTDAGGGT
jgi:hypothetical protein